MTQEQSEALRLATEFEQCIECDAIPSIIDVEKAEAELRRLHAENEALRKELERAKQSASLIRDALHSIPESQS